MAQGKTDDNGAFDLNIDQTPADSVLYLVPKAAPRRPPVDKGPNDAIALMTVLGTSLPKTVTVNELTTVASAFTAARFIDGESISGNPLGLRIAAGNVPNLVDPATGNWGKVLLDPLNSSMTTTMANLDTLGSLISAYFTVANDDWRARFLKVATPPNGVTPQNTLEAMASIARAPWAAPKELYALFDEAYPLPAPDGRRSAPFIPYLVWSPDDFCLSLCFSGGGNYAAGRLMFDAEGNLWSGQNWLPGSQSGVNKSTGGGVSKFTPNGTPLSPPITGFTGMGIDGVGWGTAVANDKVWITSFNGKILVLNFDGTPAAKESDLPIKEKLLGLMGVGIAASGDVWIADGSDNQLLYFPKGEIKAGKIVKVAPIANAGPSQSAVVGETVTLNGSKSTDPLGLPLTYKWSLVSAPKGSKATISNPTAKIASFVPDLPGTYVVQLTVYDGFLYSSPATAEIQAVTPQTQLTLNIRRLQNVIEGLLPSAFKQPRLQEDLIKELNAVLSSISAHNYANALEQLQNDILTKVDGCATTGAPDMDDWIINCPDQSMVYTPLLNIIAEVKALSGG